MQKPTKFSDKRKKISEIKSETEKEKNGKSKKEKKTKSEIKSEIPRKKKNNFRKINYFQKNRKYF